MSSILGDFSQLPLNVALGAGPDTAQNPMPAGPPLVSSQNPLPAGPSSIPDSSIPPLFPYPQPPVAPLNPPLPDSTQPQYVTDFTRMFELLTDNQVAFQQGVMQLLGQPASAPKLGSSVKVRNPHMFSGKHEEVTPFLITLFNSTLLVFLPTIIRSFSSPYTLKTASWSNGLITWRLLPLHFFTTGQDLSMNSKRSSLTHV